ELAEIAGGDVDVLVATAGQVHEDQPARAELGADVEGAGERVGALDRRDDALGRREQPERLHRGVVGDRKVLAAAGVVQVRVLRANARIVEPGRDRARLGDLALLVLQHVGARTMKDAGLARGQRRRVLPGLHAVPGGLAADQAYARVREEGVEQAD